jgi:hypothetical protein
MTLRATLLLFCLASCKPQTAATAAPEPALAAPGASCLDRQIAARGLNEFGDPPGTMYAGGTPLFNEASGKRTTREEYVLARHPELARACEKDGG